MTRVFVLLSALLTVATGFVISTRKLPIAPCRPHTETSQLSMKLFDWKRREADESAINDVENIIFTETNVRPAPGSRHKKTRKGRGISAGQGATCGFGMRGQSSRSGRPERPGFEGGQNPLYRRTPKLRGRPLGPGHKRVIYKPIKLDSLNSNADGSTVTTVELVTATKQPNKCGAIYKIVGGGELTAKNLVVNAHAFTASARAAIEENGGTCVVTPLSHVRRKRNDTTPKTEEQIATAAKVAGIAALDEQQKAKREAILEIITKAKADGMQMATDEDLQGWIQREQEVFA
uniref:Large ribosomal subunit protein uL15/eL18 domain-containing protein n=1 Tax=Octactis speculum TaxID=3111310 RepID=A0A7S2HSR2_9STRA